MEVAVLAHAHSAGHGRRGPRAPLVLAVAGPPRRLPGASSRGRGRAPRRRGRRSRRPPRAVRPPRALRAAGTAPCVSRRAWMAACARPSSPSASLEAWRGGPRRRRPLPHQLEPALAVVRHDARRLLLADAVGLGKTIEAGLVLAELRARSMLDRALVLAPPGLCDQWCAELTSRFGSMPSSPTPAGFAPEARAAGGRQSLVHPGRPRRLARLREAPGGRGGASTSSTGTPSSSTKRILRRVTANAGPPRMRWRPRPASCS